uniref:Uncharacterized protein n=1 Tax=Citrobacter freundii TaxID=546 RepID=A0A3T0VEB2_CITFR|nr:hypothetical protein [Citrobacter freundii]
MMPLIPHVADSRGNRLLMPVSLRILLLSFPVIHSNTQIYIDGNKKYLS